MKLGQELGYEWLALKEYIRREQTIEREERG